MGLSQTQARIVKSGRLLISLEPASEVRSLQLYSKSVVIIFMTMHKYVLLAAFAFSILFSDAQQIKQFNVDDNLTVSFPSVPDSFRQMGTRIFLARTDSLIFQAMIQDSMELAILDKAQFESALKGIYQGYKNKLSEFSPVKKDTAFGDIKGIFVYGSNSERNSEFKKIYAFCTVVNGHAYFIQIYSYSENVRHELIDNYFGSIRFKGANYPADGSIGYRIGYLLGMLFCVGVVVVVVILLVRRFLK